MSRFHTVCQINDIGIGESRMFLVNETPVGVFRIEDGFYALHNSCPHAGASLAHGLLEGDVVSCRIHHWRFCVKDGTYLDQNEPRWNAKTFPVRIIGNDVLVELP